MQCETYLCAGTTRESRGTSRSSRSLKNKRGMLVEIHKDIYKIVKNANYKSR